MEKPVPMDRVLVGDVGFETEVALRGCDKGCRGREQVAVLIPATLLAEQHFENFISG